MPRNRMIKPSFWEDEKLATLSRDARLTYIGLWNFSDDYGVVKGHYNWLKNTLYPYECGLKLDEFVDWMKELKELNRIIPFSVNGERYFYLPKFTEHQTINRPSLQKYPDPPEEILQHSCHTHVPLTAEVKLKEVKLKEIKDHFEKFWSAYPLKKAKKKAREIFIKLSKDKILPNSEILVAAIEGQAAEKEKLKRENKFFPEWKHPTTWLNQGCWEDEVQEDDEERKYQEWIKSDSEKRS